MGDSAAANGQQQQQVGEPAREAVTNPPTLQLGRSDREEGGVRRRGSFLGRRKPSRSNVAPPTPNIEEPQEEILIVSEPGGRSPRSGFGNNAMGGGRDKALPPPPAPVMPDFSVQEQFADMTLKPPTEGAGVQRKTSLMKKLKAKIG